MKYAGNEFGFENKTSGADLALFYHMNYGYVRWEQVAFG